MGRIEDSVITTHGNHVSRCDYIFKGVEDLVEAQVVQREAGAIEILVVLPLAGELATVEERVRAGVRDFIDPALRVTVRHVQRIERGASGKFRPVVRLMDD